MFHCKIAVFLEQTKRLESANVYTNVTILITGDSFGVEGSIIHTKMFFDIS